MKMDKVSPEDRDLIVEIATKYNLIEFGDNNEIQDVTERGVLLWSILVQALIWTGHSPGGMIEFTLAQAVCHYDSGHSNFSLLRKFMEQMGHADEN
jgi:hypothetical protein